VRKYPVPLQALARRIGIGREEGEEGGLDPRAVPVVVVAREMAQIAPAFRITQPRGALLTASSDTSPVIFFQAQKFG